MNQIRNEIEQERAQNERRVSDYRALVAMLCAGVEGEARPAERVTTVITVLATLAFCAWIAWKMFR